MSVPEPLFVDDPGQVVNWSRTKSRNKNIPDRSAQKILNQKCEWVMGVFGDHFWSDGFLAEVFCNHCEGYYHDVNSNPCPKSVRLPNIYIIPEGAELRRVTNGDLRRWGGSAWYLAFESFNGPTSSDREAWERLRAYHADLSEYADSCGANDEGTRVSAAPPDGYYWLHYTSDHRLGTQGWCLTPIEAEPVSDEQAEQIRFGLTAKALPKGDTLHNWIGSCLWAGRLHGLLLVHPDGPDAGIARIDR